MPIYSFRWQRPAMRHETRFAVHDSTCFIEFMRNRFSYFTKEQRYTFYYPVVSTKYSDSLRFSSHKRTTVFVYGAYKCRQIWFVTSLYIAFTHVGKLRVICLPHQQHASGLWVRKLMHRWLAFFILNCQSLHSMSRRPINNMLSWSIEAL